MDDAACALLSLADEGFAEKWSSLEPPVSVVHENASRGHVRDTNLIHTVYSPLKSPLVFAGRPFKTLRRGLFALMVLSTITPTFAAILPPELRTSGSPDEAPIKALFNEAVKLLSSAQPADVSKGREMIVAETAAIPGKGDPSVAFLATYAQNLNAAVAPLLASTEMRVRLNAAIAIARVADRADAGAVNLKDAVLKILADQSEGVALWGMKAARPMLKVLSAPGVAGFQQMLTAVDATGAKFPATTSAAYFALSVDKASSTATPALVDAIQKLLASRITIWAEKVPMDPEAENLACSTLVDTKWWSQHTPAEKKQSLKLLGKLAVAGGKQVVGTVSEAQRQSINVVVLQVARSVAAVGVIDSKPALVEGVKSILRDLKPTSTPQVTADASKTIGDVLQKEYPDLAATMSAGISTADPQTVAPANSRTSIASK